MELKGKRKRGSFMLWIGRTATVSFIVGIVLTSSVGLLIAGNDDNTKKRQSGMVVRGMDVSHYQEKVRWDIVKQSGIHFAYVKATGGNTYKDPEFADNWHGMREAGIFRGAYHFFYASDDPKTQAEHFVRTVGKLRSFDLPPVLDVEITDGESKAKIAKGVSIWLNTVERLLGRKPIVYTDPALGNRYLADEKFADYRLWIAEYGVKVPTMPRAWKNKGWTFWQSTQGGTVPGVKGKVDLDVFNGADLMRLIEDSRVR